MGCVSGPGMCLGVVSEVAASFDESGPLGSWLVIPLRLRQFATTPPLTDFRASGDWGIASNKKTIEVIQRSTCLAVSYQTDNTIQWAKLLGTAKHTHNSAYLTCG